VTDESGEPEIRVVDTLDDSGGIADYEGIDDDEFGVILDGYLATGRAARGTVGGAEAELIDGQDLVTFAVEWIATHAAGAHRPPI
jgi:aminoglycoside N3'-acetyltransferase